MREIKFRAWDKKIKKWVNPDAISITLSGTPMAPDETWMEHNLADLALMQFTGLHDRHGKEIYEGDLVKVDSYYIGDSFIKEHRAEIKYGNGGFYIDYDFAPELCEEEIYNEQIEVIGNIYESP